MRIELQPARALTPHALLAATLLSFSTAPLPAQTLASEPGSPRFEVASIKSVRSQDAPSKMSTTTPGRFVATNTPLRFLVYYAYDLHGDYELVGAPAWMFDQGFDVIGTFPPGTPPTDQQKRLLVQNLLFDRLALKGHYEPRQIPSFELVTAHKDRSLGPQLHPSEVDCAKWIADRRPQTDAGGASPVSPSGKRPACKMLATRRFLTGGTRTMSDLAGVLQALTERPVINKTGLPGAFDIDLAWSPGEFGGGANTTPAQTDGPSLFTALEEQLGLKLVPTRSEFKTIVIDNIQRPSDN